MKKNSSWINPKLAVRKSKIHNKGIFAKASIKKGERLAIFGGDVMLIDEINNLPDKLQDYPMQIEERFVIGSRNYHDAEDTDFFNHSCDPNSGFNGQIFLVAMRDIKKDEEITFDYAMVVSESVGSAIVFEMDCNCGTRKCRKKITENDWKITELQEKYRGYFSQYLQEKIDRNYGNVINQNSRKKGDYDFTELNEGDIEPSLGKKIETLIKSEKYFIVYLDEDDFVQWSTHTKYGNLPNYFGKIFNEVAHLETMSIALLSERHLGPFRRLLGECTSRLLEKNEKSALEILEKAKAFLEARSTERARIWYLGSSLVITAFTMIVVLILWNFREKIDTKLFSILISAPFGSLGAMISVVTRSQKLILEPAAGPTIHFLESFARSIAGIIGALLLALAIKAKLILGFTEAVDNSLLFLMAMSIIAGASERIVPNLIHQVESSLEDNKKKED
jgi:hypothetical protein